LLKKIDANVKDQRDRITGMQGQLRTLPGDRCAGGHNRRGGVMAEDPWRGIRLGDRFYLAGVNKWEIGSRIWCRVTDLWYDPVRGQHNPKRGYMAAIDPMGIGHKRAVSIGKLAGKDYVRCDIADAKAAADADWIKK
jgi:hypothetical protein